MRHGGYHIKGYLVGLMIILVACSGDDVAEEGGTDSYTPLQIGDTYLGISTRSSDTELTNGDIGIFRTESTGYAGTRSNVQYSHSGSGWNVASDTEAIYLNKNEASLCSYYPYNSDDDYTDGTVTLTSQLYAGAADLCYQTGVTASSSSEEVSFTLGHAYAKLTFTLIRDAAYSGPCAVSGISIANDGILTANTLDLTTGRYGSGTAGMVTVDPEVSSISGGSSATATVLMVPTVATLSGDITLTFNVDGVAKTTTVDADDVSLTSLEAGENYNINIELSSRASVVPETANCYILAPSRAIRIPVNIKGNGNADAVAGTGLDVTHTAWSVGVLWESSSDLITLSAFSMSQQTITVAASSLTGNAVIAAYDEDGESILWSWHIWVTDYDPDDGGTTYTITNDANSSYTFMDRNLGATTSTPGEITTLGLVYQWGRKDPFSGPASVSSSDNDLTLYDATGKILSFTITEVTASNNLANAIENPLTFYTGTGGDEIGYDWYTATNSHLAQNDFLWGSSAETAEASDKTIYDPCPAGWRVPAWKGGSSPWSILGNSTAISDVGTLANYGVTFTAVDLGFWPLVGFRLHNTGSLWSTGSYGGYWSASCSSRYPSYCYILEINSLINTESYFNHRSAGTSVRCVRE